MEKEKYLSSFPFFSNPAFQYSTIPLFQLFSVAELSSDSIDMGGCTIVEKMVLQGAS